MTSFFSQTGIEADARNAESLLRYAFNHARNRNTVSVIDKQLLNAGATHSLSAVNSHGRIAWGRELSAEFADCFCDDPGTHDHNQLLHFVTLIDIACVTKVSADDLALRAITRRLRRGLRGLSYIAVIEPAFYVNLKVGISYKEQRRLSWHLHAVVWGISSIDLKERVLTLNRSGQYVTLLPVRKGAQQKMIRRGTLPQVLGYMCKPPVNGYRVTQYDRKRNGEYIVDQHGEIKAGFLQGKQPLRPGQHVDLFHVMKGLTLDNLTIAGGQGCQLLARAKRALRFD
jgi:hypothetical protein